VHILVGMVHFHIPVCFRLQSKGSKTVIFTFLVHIHPCFAALDDDEESILMGAPVSVSLRSAA
jgi:hypothetical protein